MPIGYHLPWSYLRQLETIRGMAKPSPSHAGNPALTALGTAIRERRAKLGISQENLAFKADLDRSYIGGIERGEHNISLINLCRIAQALDMSAGKLLVLADL
jgi:DNA-binding XRE family transcriptional regulator